MEKRLDDIINTKSKVKIIRLFTSRREDFMASGTDIAKLVGFTPPAAHASLKELYIQGILRRDIIGKQHIYRLNIANRMVKDILKPAFQRELSIKEDIKPSRILNEEKFKLLDLYSDYFNSSGSPYEKANKAKLLAKMLLDI